MVVTETATVAKTALPALTKEMRGEPQQRALVVAQWHGRGGGVAEHAATAAAAVLDMQTAVTEAEKALVASGSLLTAEVVPVLHPAAGAEAAIKAAMTPTERLKNVLQTNKNGTRV